MPIPFVAGPAATHAFEVITGLLPTTHPASTNASSASVDELVAALNAVQGHMADFLMELMARGIGPTAHESHLLASLYNISQQIPVDRRSFLWMGWLRPPPDGSRLYSGEDRLNREFTTAVVPTTTEGSAEDRTPAPLSPAVLSQVPAVVELSRETPLFLPSPSPPRDLQASFAVSSALDL
ncbi:uncharacterized protein LACBIDRAFT_300273 [Laccaria bicolor S238N-H82]|uniref:Predicted protein n=1 Tax=Laccaria bicolor (strain S238N-H82 / ATCC MYA-4686) TaxID=486041 RepID=B0DGD1_LACBS|nr:uncharacterized protein LACBIDRAFT_300273 [Laccaria bicolor S238N-H82]EDR06253.1 predicted protein [Laccaria bicolor S238N-H82]|eukprot:XP_001883114.1 predicted protein [Laccaria bicolor S238N-H82]